MAAISLNKILNKYVNKPSVTSSGIVLYTHSKEYNGELNSIEKIAVNNPRIYAAGQNNYSSPTNVRRLFITGNRVVIQTYKPIIRNGKPDGNGCWSEYKFKDEDNIGKVAVDMLDYSRKMEEYTFEKMQGNTDAEKPKLDSLTGNVFRSVYKPWVMGNIEEIYIDWTVLCTDDIINRYTDAAIIVEDCHSKRGSGIKNSNLLQAIFEDANSGDVKSIRNRYPRLKCLTMISNLDKILQANYDKGKTNTDAVAEYSKFWYESNINSQLIKQSDSIIIINRLTDGIDAINKEFTVRNGIYKFDDEILKEFVEETKEKMLKYAREKRDNKLDLGDYGEEVEKSPIEEYLDNIEASEGAGKAKMIFYLALSNTGKSEAEEIRSSLSSKYKQKYL